MVPWCTRSRSVEGRVYIGVYVKSFTRELPLTRRVEGEMEMKTLLGVPGAMTSLSSNYVSLGVEIDIGSG